MSTERVRVSQEEINRVREFAPEAMVMEAVSVMEVFRAPKDRWARFRAAGLFKDGLHTNKTVQATTPDGRMVEVSVDPVHVNDKRDTLFAPLPSEASKMAEIFPRESTGFI